MNNSRRDGVRLLGRKEKKKTTGSRVLSPGKNKEGGKEKASTSASKTMVAQDAQGKPTNLSTVEPQGTQSRPSNSGKYDRLLAT